MCAHSAPWRLNCTIVHWALMPTVRRGTTQTCPKATVDNQQYPRRLPVTPASQRFDRLLHDSCCVNGWKPRNMPQKTLGSIISLLCAVASLVQVSRRLRICRRPMLVSRGRGFQGGWRPSAVPFCLLHKGNRARTVTVNCGWRQLLKVLLRFRALLRWKVWIGTQKLYGCVIMFLHFDWKWTLAVANLYPVFGVFI